LPALSWPISSLEILLREVVDLTQNAGHDMQPEFGKNNAKAAMVNYSKVKSGGEVQDELRQGTPAKTDG